MTEEKLYDIMLKKVKDIDKLTNNRSTVFITYPTTKTKRRMIVFGSRVEIAQAIMQILKTDKRICSLLETYVSNEMREVHDMIKQQPPSYMR